MPPRRCSTCGQPLTQCGCPIPPPPDTSARVLALQEARRTHRLAIAALLTGYAQWSPQPPAEARETVKNLCAQLVRTLFPPRSHGGAPLDYAKAAFHEKYWIAFEKVRFANLQRHNPRVMVKQVAAELGMPVRTFHDYRKRYKLPLPPPPPEDG